MTLWENLWRDEYVRAHRAVNHWAWNHRAMAGPAFTELITEYVPGQRADDAAARDSAAAPCGSRTSPCPR